MSINIHLAIDMDITLLGITTGMGYPPLWMDTPPLKIDIDTLCLWITVGIDINTLHFWVDMGDIDTPSTSEHMFYLHVMSAMSLIFREGFITCFRNFAAARRGYESRKGYSIQCPSAGLFCISCVGTFLWVVLESLQADPNEHFFSHFNHRLGSLLL